MIEITNVLFWISTGLLIPVVVVLLIVFIQSLVMGGSFLGMYLSRMKFQKELVLRLHSIKSGEQDIQFLNHIKGNAAFKHAMLEVTGTSNPLFAEKALADFEVLTNKDLAKSKSISKLGPMLGLMGTLIPMGPALVGLASGDISSMAQNMQVAFSTTVVGLFAGALGYVLQLTKQRWYTSDLSNLEFAYELRFNQK